MCTQNKICCEGEEKSRQFADALRECKYGMTSNENVIIFPLKI
jgi:hypothetical protein